MTTKVKAEEISRQLQATGKPFLMLIEDGKGEVYFDYASNNLGTEYIFAGFAINKFLVLAEANGKLKEAQRELKKIIDAPPTITN